MKTYTYSDLVYDALYWPERGSDNQNSYCGDARLGGDWKKRQGVRVTMSAYKRHYSP